MKQKILYSEAEPQIIKSTIDQQQQLVTKWISNIIYVIVTRLYLNPALKQKSLYSKAEPQIIKSTIDQQQQLVTIAQ